MLSIAVVVDVHEGFIHHLFREIFTVSNTPVARFYSIGGVYAICPLCKKTFVKGVDIQVKDIAEIVAEAMV